MVGESPCILYYLRDILRRSYSTVRGIRVNNKLYYYISEREREEPGGGERYNRI